jgi:hypothetical protein
LLGHGVPPAWFTYNINTNVKLMSHFHFAKVVNQKL